MRNKTIRILYSAIFQKWKFLPCFSLQFPLFGLLCINLLIIRRFILPRLPDIYQTKSTHITLATIKMFWSTFWHLLAWSVGKPISRIIILAVIKFLDYLSSQIQFGLCKFQADNTKKESVKKVIFKDRAGFQFRSNTKSLNTISVYVTSRTRNFKEKRCFEISNTDTLYDSDSFLLILVSIY